MVHRVQRRGVPVSAFFDAIYRRFFHAGQEGLSASRALALRVAPAALGYGLFAWACIGLGAPWVAALFGAGFADSGATGPPEQEWRTRASCALPLA